MTKREPPVSASILDARNQADLKRRVNGIVKDILGLPGIIKGRKVFLNIIATVALLLLILVADAAQLGADGWATFLIIVVLVLLGIWL